MEGSLQCEISSVSQVKPGLLQLILKRQDDSKDIFGHALKSCEILVMFCTLLTYEVRWRLFVTEVLILNTRNRRVLWFQGSELVESLVGGRFLENRPLIPFWAEV